MSSHGDRAHYRAGCRCAPCRAANTAYEVERLRRATIGQARMVPVRRARAHLLALRRAGVGKQSVSAATDLAEITIHEIAAGERITIRARTEQLILAVTPAMLDDRARVPAGPTKARLAELREEGYTMPFLARRLGYRRPWFDIGRRGWVFARTEYRIERLHRELTT